MPFAGYEIKLNFLEDIAVAAPAGVVTPYDLTPQKELPKTRPLWGLLIEYRFHVQVVGAAGNASVLNAEFPLGAVDRMRVEGSSRYFPTGDVYNLQCPTAFKFHNLYRDYPVAAWVSQAGGTFTHGTGLYKGLQITGDALGTAATGPTAGAATTHYDVIVFYLVPFVPLGITDPNQTALYMLNGPDWNPLILHNLVADQSGLFDVKANTTITFGALQINAAATAGGVAAPAGSPLIRLHAIFPNLRRVGLENSPDLGKRLLVRSFQNVTSTLQAANLADGLIARLTTGKRRYWRSLLKVGSKPTDVPTAGVGGVINTLSDGIITFPLIKRATVRQQVPQDTQIWKEFVKFTSNVQLPLGYYLHDWVAHGNPATAFNVAGLSKDDFTIEGGVVSGANQIGELLEETEIRASA